MVPARRDADAGACRDPNSWKSRTCRRQPEAGSSWCCPAARPDGVLVNLCNLAPLRHPRQLLLLHDAQFLFPDNGYPARQRLGYRFLVPRMAKASAAVLTVSQYSRAILDLTRVIARERTEVLHNGADHIRESAADPDAIARFGLERGRFVVLFGSTKPYKNVDVVFRAFAEAAAPAAIRLVVIGPTAETLAQAGYVAPAGTAFVGAVDDAALRALYEAAFCLAFPSRTEGFGLPPAEAMLCGCPAVVAPAGAIPEVCADAALYADVDSPAEWADAFARLAADPALRAAKVAQGHARAARFTWAAAGAALHARIVRLAA